MNYNIKMTNKMWRPEEEHDDFLILMPLCDETREFLYDIIENEDILLGSNM